MILLPEKDEMQSNAAKARANARDCEPRGVK
jgi:hypothetical protein